MGRRKKQPTAQPLLLTIPEVAIQLGVCRTTVYHLIYHKGLPSAILGSSRRIHPDSLPRMAEDMRTIGRIGMWKMLYLWVRYMFATWRKHEKTKATRARRGLNLSA